MLNLSPFGVEQGVVDYYLARSAGCQHAGGPEQAKQDMIEYYAAGARRAACGSARGRPGWGWPARSTPASSGRCCWTGRRPDGVQRVGPQHRRNEAGELVDKRVAGVDCCFRAPKSVSLLFAFGDQLAVDAVRDAHEHAAAEALRYLEQVGSYSRRGKAGAGERVAGHGFIAAGFRHRDARPECGAQTIAYHLAHRREPVPSVATVHRVLVRGMVTPQPQKRPKVVWQRFEWPRPNDAWQIDATCWALADGRTVWIMMSSTTIPVRSQRPASTPVPRHEPPGTPSPQPCWVGAAGACRERQRQLFHRPAQPARRRRLRADAAVPGH